eukprot:1194756-Prorocentrum_minimum.AAC.6
MALATGILDTGATGLSLGCFVHRGRCRGTGTPHKTKLRRILQYHQRCVHSFPSRPLSIVWGTPARDAHLAVVLLQRSLRALRARANRLCLIPHERA